VEGSHLGELVGVRVFGHVTDPQIPGQHDHDALAFGAVPSDGRRGSGAGTRGGGW